MFSSSRFLSCDQFLKARIAADRIPYRFDLQHCRRNRTSILYLQQPLENGNRVVGSAQRSVNFRHAFLFNGPSNLDARLLLRTQVAFALMQS